jgi:putative oxidoreductase
LKKKIIFIVRIVLGLFLLAMGLINLLNPVPSLEFSESGNKFMIALTETGYMMVLVYCLMVLVSLSLLINRFVPLTLIIFMPITVNIILFHAFLDIQSILPALVIGFLHIYLIFVYIASYKPLMKAKNSHVSTRVSHPKNSTEDSSFPNRNHQ